MKRTIGRRIILTVAIFSIYLTSFIQASPKLSVIIIVDQFAYHYLPKLKNHLKGGIGYLMKNGINYQHARHAHGTPETAPGHNAFNTGVLPAVHGAVNNKWIIPKGDLIQYEFDSNVKETAVYKDEHTFDCCGMSPVHTDVEGFSDEFVRTSNLQEEHEVFSLTLKGVAGIATAGKTGKAIWFDDATGLFTSSKYYYPENLPTWLNNFNHTAGITSLKTFPWKLAYKKNDPAYKFPFINDYSAATLKSITGTKLSIDHKKHHPFDLFIRTPAASEKLFELAEICLENNLPTDSNKKMVLWLCVSNLDLIGHLFGPDSKECIDTVYHTDQQLKKFMDAVNARYGETNVLYALSGDHGVQPLQEVSRKKGIKTARRILTEPLIKKMNAFIEKKYQIKNIVKTFIASYFVFDHPRFQSLSQEQQTAIATDLRNMLQQIPGIKNAWTRSDLETGSFTFEQPEQFYKNHLRPDREIDLIVMPEEYSLVTPYKTGASHDTPYDYDTHVPLIFYQKNMFHNKTIETPVWIPQVANTLSKIYGIQHPIQSNLDVLPAFFDSEKPKVNIQKKPHPSTPTSLKH